MKKIIFAVIIISGLSGCLDPNYYIWRDSEETAFNSYIESPWSGPNERVIEQYTKYLLPYSDKNYGYGNRWKVSFFNKTSAHSEGYKSMKYLLKNNILYKWGFKKYSDGKGIFEQATPPYELKIISVSPTIITMRPYLGPKDERSPEKIGLLYSDYSHNPILYGTKISFQDNLLFFSPDLNILPQPLNITKNGSVTIHWDRLFNSGAIVFTEKNGVVQTKRIENKEGKDFKKDGLYDPKHHLNLIKH